MHTEYTNAILCFERIPAATNDVPACCFVLGAGCAAVRPSCCCSGVQGEQLRQNVLHVERATLHSIGASCHIRAAAASVHTRQHALVRDSCRCHQHQHHAGQNHAIPPAGPPHAKAFCANVRIKCALHRRAHAHSGDKHAPHQDNSFPGPVILSALQG